MPPKTCHDTWMAKLKRLLDVYRFPGFVPQATLRGLFGDSWALVVTLRRRRKKLSAAPVGIRAGLFMTKGRAGPAISPAATDASTWSFLPAGWIVPTVRT